ncbi:TetR/AcrR family transcriptional regulator [Xanthobacter autotrophicus]|uniref:TetR/AcrR family transcriptional regulator n=1 Tax=Xanthobacter autotrophicus TaxID=280 RepID=UPI00372778A0
MTVVEPAAAASATDVAIRDRIRDTAALLFSERGYEAVSMRDICAAAGVSKGAVYHHFLSKEDLLSAIITDALTALLAHIEGSIHDRPPGAAQLRGFIVSQAEFFERNAPHFRVATARFDAVGTVASQADIKALRERYVTILRRVIEDGIAGGEFAAVDVLAASRMVLAILYWLGRWYRPGGSLRATEIAAEHADMMLNGVLVRR